MTSKATPGRSGSATVRPFLLAPRDWQAIALREAAELTGAPEGAARLAESKRYAALADEIERLRARVLDLEAVHEDASGAILQAVAAERERWAKLCDSYQPRSRRHEYDRGAGEVLDTLRAAASGPNAEFTRR